MRWVMWPGALSRGQGKTTVGKQDRFNGPAVVIYVADLVKKDRRISIKERLTEALKLLL